jgi:hypothetical protein
MKQRRNVGRPYAAATQRQKKVASFFRTSPRRQPPVIFREHFLRPVTAGYASAGAQDSRVGASYVYHGRRSGRLQCPRAQPRCCGTRTTGGVTVVSKPGLPLPAHGGFGRRASRTGGRRMNAPCGNRGPAALSAIPEAPAVSMRRHRRDGTRDRGTGPVFEFSSRGPV